MKTKNNTQKTVNDQLKMMVLRGIAALFTFVVISLTTVNAQDYLTQFFTESNSDKMAILPDKQPSETNFDANVSLNSEEMNVEVLMNNLKYNAQDFVDAELATEIENAKNSAEDTDNEAVEALMNDLKYNAQDFVDAEMATEIRNAKNSVEDNDNEAIEAFINHLKYNAQDFVDAEMATEIENRMTNENFVKSAKTFNFLGVDQELYSKIKNSNPAGSEN